MPISDEYSPRVVAILRAAGWSPDRRVDIDPWQQVLGGEGYHLSDLVAEVLGSLGGLQVRPTVPGPYAAPLLFEPVLAGSGALDVAEDFEARFGQRFYPIAEWISNSCVFLGERGKVVSYDDIELLDIADTFPAALDVFLLAAAEPTVLG